MDRLLSVWTLCAMVNIGMYSVLGYEDYGAARRYVLNLTQATWFDARDTCSKGGGSLATLYDIATVPDLNFTAALKPTEGIFWIGFNNDNNAGWVWDGDDVVTWNNWQPGEPSTGSCAVSNHSYPFHWSVQSCDRKFPYMCQYDGDSCTFTRFPNLTIFGHNFMYLFNKTETECMIRCVGSRDNTCMSFEYSPHVGTCEFNTGNRWSLKRDVISLRGWVYFHRTCNFGEVTGTYIESSSIAPTPASSSLVCQDMYTTKQIFITHDIFVSSMVPVTSEVYVTHDLTVTQTQTQTVIQTQILTQMSTVKATVTSTHVITPSPVLIIPSSSVFQKAIVELQEMETVIKEKRKALTKVSVEDNRPSATYVGYVAIIFMSSVFGAIVLFDLLTVFRYHKCCFTQTKKGKVIRTPSIESLSEPPPAPIPAFDLTALVKRGQKKEELGESGKTKKEASEALNEGEAVEVKSNKDSGENTARIKCIKRPIEQRRLWRQQHWSSIGDSGFDGSESASDTTGNSENGSYMFDFHGSISNAITERNEDTSASVSSETGVVAEQEIVSVDIESNCPDAHEVVVDKEEQKKDDDGGDDVSVVIAEDEGGTAKVPWKKGPFTRL